MKELIQLIKGLQGNVLVLSHSRADVDAFASSTSLYLVLKSFLNSSLAVIDSLNAEAKALAKNLNIDFILNPSLNEFDVLVLLDFNSLKLFGSLENDFKNFNGKVIIIDHHSKSNDLIKADYSFIQEDFISTTEILFLLFNEMNFPINKLIASLLAVGIISDSANFSVADKLCFKAMYSLLEISGKSFLELKMLYSAEETISERIAVLKALNRVKVYRINNFLIALTKIDFFESGAAMNLINSGADISFVLGTSNNETRISSRASNRVLALGFDLSKDVFEVINKEFLGSAGGHPGAAGYNGKANPEELLHKCKQLSIDFLFKKFPKEKLQTIID